MAAFTQSPILGERYARAVAFALSAHQFQVRKDGTPYIAHLQAVAALVAECGGDEDEAIAAMLHDYPEDIHSENPSEGLEIIQQRFGKQVAGIVRGCTELDKGQSWRERKDSYLEQIREGGESVALVSMSDKYHNLLSYLRGAKLSKQDESQSPENRLRTWWFLNACYQCYGKHRRCCSTAIFGEYEQALQKLKALWVLEIK